MAEKTLTKRALNRATLARQLLLERRKIKPVAVIEQLVGLQAQIPRPPFIGLWSRIEGFQRQDLLKLIARHDVVRGTMMRGTIHLMSRGDYAKFRATMQPMLSQGSTQVLKDRKALDRDELVACGRAFFDEAPRTFDGLRDHLAERFPGCDERACAYTVRMHLPLVMVPSETRWGWTGAADFAVAESWLGERLDLSDERKALALRYLAGFGPASVADMQNWSGLKNLRGVFEELRPKLKTFRDEKGRELFDLPRAPRPDEDVEAPVRFLPDYDNVLLGHADRSRVIAEEHRKRIATANLMVLPTFLVDGVVAGTWKIQREKNDATLAINPFVKLSKETKDELEEEGQKLVGFVEAGLGPRPTSPPADPSPAC